MYSLVVTAAFERDYDDALAYLTYNLKSPQAATRLMDEMDKAFAQIAGNPLINAISRKPSLARLEYREQRAANYVLLYGIEGDDVVVKRLFHMSQAYEEYV
ncbi:MAG: type II toxin-antitoxin system RelE/ParE family toxin [Eggerthellaceae bacterium]|nr:type II toxin-antitoxin system RelE/ParE family toxin [Eggerthellaceae bacterium]